MDSTNWIQTILELLLVGLVAGLGAYFGAYLKVKGQNWAKQQDTDLILEEVRATTKATKEIEAKISNEVWDRQKQWELKREIVREAANRVGILWTALENLSVAYRTRNLNNGQGVQTYEEMVSDANEKWFHALAKYEQTGLFVDSFCGREMSSAFAELRTLALTIAYALNQGDIDILKNRYSALLSAKSTVRDAIRSELLTSGTTSKN